MLPKPFGKRLMGVFGRDGLGWEHQNLLITKIKTMDIIYLLMLAVAGTQSQHEIYSPKSKT